MRCLLCEAVVQSIDKSAANIELPSSNSSQGSERKMVALTEMYLREITAV